MARILVAEDDAAVRSFVTRALAHRGHDVAAADDGVEALEVLTRNAEPFDLLLTDIVMPRLDGIALALKVARDWPGLPVLLMTGYSAERQRAHNLDELICEVIAKPFTLERLCAIVARHVDRPTAAAAAARRGAMPERPSELA